MHRLANRAGFPAHFKDQVFTSETDTDLGAQNPFAGNAAFSFMCQSSKGPPSPAALECGKRKSKSLTLDGYDAGSLLHPQEKDTCLLPGLQELVKSDMSTSPEQAWSRSSASHQWTVPLHLETYGW